MSDKDPDQAPHSRDWGAWPDLPTTPPRRRRKPTRLAPGGLPRPTDAQGTDGQGAGASGIGGSGFGGSGFGARGADGQGADARGPGGQGPDARGAGVPGAGASGADASALDAPSSRASGRGRSGRSTTSGRRGGRLTGRGRGASDDPTGTPGRSSRGSRNGDGPWADPAPANSRSSDGDRDTGWAPGGSGGWSRGDDDRGGGRRRFDDGRDERAGGGWPSPDEWQELRRSRSAAPSSPEPDPAAPQSEAAAFPGTAGTAHPFFGSGDAASAGDRTEPAPWEAPTASVSFTEPPQFEFADSKPLESDPAGFELTGSGPAELTGSGPAELTGSGPAEPAGSEPIGPEPVGSASVAPDARGLEPVGSDATRFDPTRPDPTRPDPAGADAAGEPVGSDSAEPDLASPDLVGSDSVGPEPVGSDRAGTEPAGAQPGEVGPEPGLSFTSDSSEPPPPFVPREAEPEPPPAPSASDPSASDPSASDPSASDPSASDPSASDPSASEPAPPFERADPEPSPPVAQNPGAGSGGRVEAAFGGLFEDGGSDEGRSEEPGEWGSGKGRRSGGKGRYGKGRRSGRGAAGGGGRGAGRGWLPDGPDQDSPAGTTPHADPESVARAICLRLLTMAPKTRAQLAEALRKRDVPDEAAETVLDRFSELGLINDEAFAEAWVDSRHHGRGLAKRALAAELRHRGVDSETVNEAVERLDPDQELETARRLVERKLASTRSLDPKARTRRLAGMLARKGYPSGLAFRVVREALEQEGIEMEDDYP
ncbi:recombination regulator RecX [Nonomuraea sp. NPDC003214]